MKDSPDYFKLLDHRLGIIQGILYDFRVLCHIKGIQASRVALFAFLSDLNHIENDILYAKMRDYFGGVFPTMSRTDISIKDKINCLAIAGDLIRRTPYEESV